MTRRWTERRQDPEQAREKIQTLRLIFIGIAMLMGYLGVLVAVNWTLPVGQEEPGIGVLFFQISKDILLVMTGILGSSMASVFESRSTKDQPTPAPEAATSDPTTQEGTP